MVLPKAYRLWFVLALTVVLSLALACGEDEDEDDEASPLISRTQATATSIPAAAAPTAAPEEVMAKSDAELVVASPVSFAAAHGEKPRYGGTFLAGNFEELAHYDTNQTSEWGVHVHTAPVYNGLIDYSPYDTTGSVFIPSLARSWEFSDDRLSITFNLAQDAKWQDGTPFSSADVFYTVDRMMNPPDGMVSPRRGLLNSLLTSVEAPDANTFVIHGQGPSSLMLSMWAPAYMSIIPKHISETDPIDAMKTTVMGTGAFKLAADPTIAVWRYERNADYFKDELPYLDNLEIHIIPDEQTRVAAIVSKRIFWNFPGGDCCTSAELMGAEAAQNPDLIFNEWAGGSFAYMTMQTQKAPFDDIRVRQAFSEAIDRKAFLEQNPSPGEYGGLSPPGSFWKLPFDVLAQQVGHGPDMDVRRARARELLAEYEAEKGEIDWNELAFFCASNISFSCPAAQIVQSMMKDVGVEFILDPADTLVTRNNENTGEYVAGFDGTGWSLPDPTEGYGKVFVTDGGSWYHKYTNPELEKLFEQQKFTPDPDDRREVVWEMEKMALTDSAMLSLMWRARHHLRWNFVKGWNIHPDTTSVGMRMEYVWLDFPELPFTRP